MTRSVMRALAVFDAFDAQRLSMPLQEIGKRIGLSKATTFRLVNTLEKAGFLMRLDNQEYCLSLKVVRLAGLVPSTMNIRDAARPIMQDINRRTGETITLNARLKGERVVIEVVDTPAPLMAIARAGEHISLLQGAAGRILLAYMDKEKRASLLKNIARREKFDAVSVTRELDRFRKQGYALTRGQRVPGLTAVSVPVHDHKGDVQHCIALSGPSVRVDPRDSEIVEMMVAAGAQISERLGMPRAGAA